MLFFKDLKKSSPSTHETKTLATATRKLTTASAPTASKSIETVTPSVKEPATSSSVVEYIPTSDELDKTATPQPITGNYRSYFVLMSPFITCISKLLYVCFCTCPPSCLFLSLFVSFLFFFFFFFFFGGGGGWGDVMLTCTKVLNLHESFRACSWITYQNAME